MKDWVAHWKQSIQRRKQRKYRYNAPLHIRKKYLAAPLSKELRKKHNTRNMMLRTGDKVTVKRGQHKGATGKIESVDVAQSKVIISGISLTRKDGNAVPVTFEPSNVMITELQTIISTGIYPLVVLNAMVA